MNGLWFFFGSEKTAGEGKKEPLEKKTYA
jgi:hypothetical protein